MRNLSNPPTAEEARAFIDESSFVWHQRFMLVPGVPTPGASDIEWLLWRGGFPDQLDGLSVLDVGASNAGAAFIAERRGAERVVAVDIYPPGWFGVDAIADFLGSRVEYVQGSVYELPRLVEGEFDVVLFLGVLYHLRHPLLAIDAVRAVTRMLAFIETAVADHELGADRPVVRFYRTGELGDDPSNWFAPTTSTLIDWCSSAGFLPEHVSSWPEGAAERAIVRATRSMGEPEFVQVSYERRLLASPAD